MPPKMNLVGKVFGRLTVIGRAEDRPSTTPYPIKCWLCQCSCGEMAVVAGRELSSGDTNSCGCLKKEPSRYSHLMSRTPVYRRWAGMVSRCTNPNHYAYKWYGGLGVTVCDEWRYDFTSYYQWLLAEGWTEDSDLTVDRIDNNKGYGPENCRLVTQVEQTRNQKRTKLFKAYGLTLTVGEIHEKFAPSWLGLQGFRTRLSRGMNVYAALYSQLNLSKNVSVEVPIALASYY